MSLPVFTIDDIRSWGPCYDPSRHLAEEWQGTALDMLRLEHIPPQDRLWVVLRPECLDDRTLRLFAVGCARSVQHLMTDPRSIAAIGVAERYANGEATSEELATAWDAACDAAREASAAWAAWAARAAREASAAGDAAAAWAASAWAASAAGDAQVPMLLGMLKSA